MEWDAAWNVEWNAEWTVEWNVEWDAAWNVEWNAEWTVEWNANLAFSNRLQSYFFNKFMQKCKQRKSFTFDNESGNKNWLIGCIQFYVLRQEWVHSVTLAKCNETKTSNNDTYHSS